LDRGPVARDGRLLSPDAGGGNLSDCQPTLGVVMLYARDVQRSAAFCRSHFGFVPVMPAVEGLITLPSASGRARIVIHQAAKSVKLGLAAAKLIFDVRDIEAFKAQAAVNGLMFGGTHRADGYSFSTGKDPDGNSVSISSRDLRDLRAAEG
jgi:hypothetical protein